MRSQNAHRTETPTKIQARGQTEHAVRGSKKGVLPKAEERSTRSQKEIEFRLKAPDAGFVRLAGDFTDWERNSIQMVRLSDGTWFVSVPLSPGFYSYRFIVDGHWTDDPHSENHIPNPFGASNSVVQVH